MREQTREILNVSREIDVIYNFFTPRTSRRSREEIRAELGFGDEFVVLHMSNMRPGKRIDLLLKALSEMKTRDRIRVLILAGGPTEPFETMIDQLGLRKIISIKQNQSAVEEFIAAADAGLYTSDYESFGLSILETLYFGKPVVAFQVGGIPEVAGESYPLYPFPDTSALARAMDELVQSPERARELGEQGRQHVADTFSPGRIIERYEEVYARVCERRGPTHPRLGPYSLGIVLTLGTPPRDTNRVSLPSRRTPPSARSRTRALRSMRGAPFHIGTHS